MVWAKKIFEAFFCAQPIATCEKAARKHVDEIDCGLTKRKRKKVL
jgi:hypothetical protein